MRRSVLVLAPIAVAIAGCSGDVGKRPTGVNRGLL